MDYSKTLELERSWNDRFIAQSGAATNISSSVNKSATLRKEDVERLSKSAPPPAFASVAAAFDFEHHVGTDPLLEMAVSPKI